MTDRAKFEQMLEHLINNDKTKAEEIFHELVVAKSREIYENLLDDDIQVDEETDEETDEDVEENFDMDLGQEAVGGDAADDMIDAVTGDEGDDDMDMGDDEGGDEPATKDDVMDIKDALEDLKAEFEAMLAGEESGEEESEEEGEMDFGDEEDDEEAKEEFSFEDTDEDDMEEGVVREYVEKVTAKMGDSGTNGTKSPVAGKNDMGGTTANIAKAGTGSEGGVKGGLLNPNTKDLNSGNVNVPGSKTATKMHSTSGHGAEKKGAGEQAANTKSTVGK
jgi:hypothetical protein